MTIPRDSHVEILRELRDTDYAQDESVGMRFTLERAALDAAILSLSADGGEGADLEDACADVLNRLESWGKAYPIDIFPEPDTKQREWLHATRPGLMDRISASMGRHMAACIAEDIGKLRRALQTVAATPTAEATAAHAEGDAGAWIEWEGGTQPVTGKVQYRMRTWTDFAHEDDAGNLRWDHCDGDKESDIIAYRAIATPTAEATAAHAEGDAVLVPREPTEKMRRAGNECIPYPAGRAGDAQMDHAYYVYAAMIEAAPQAPVVAQPLAVSDAMVWCDPDQLQRAVNMVATGGADCAAVMIAPSCSERFPMPLSYSPATSERLINPAGVGGTDHG